MKDYALTVIPSTGNVPQANDRYNTFMDVSGGVGSLQSQDPEAREVHVKLYSNDGSIVQGWFPLKQLMEAITAAGAVDISDGV